MKPLHLLVAVFVLFGSALAATNPVPMIYQPLLPVTVKPGSSQFTLTVNGTGFAPAAVVNWNGATRATSYISSSQVQAQISAADVANPGTVSVTVVNPAPGGGVSNTIFFSIQTPTPYAALSIASGFAGPGVSVAGDFNNDGFQDLVVADQNSIGFFIDTYFGNGDGTFKTVFPNHAVVPAVLIITGIFNRSQLLDIAASDGIANTAILMNNKGSFFLPHQVFRSPINLYSSPILGLAVGDFNGDGKLDLIATGSSANIYLGNGDGTFAGPEPINNASKFGNGNPAVGDFNGDGKLDLVVPTTYGLDVLLGNGDGTFQSPKTYSTTYLAFSVSVADVNGDGKLDLITDGMDVFLGNGDGTFTKGAAINLNNNGNFLSNPFIGDFNGDGKLDVAVGFWLLLGNGDGTFRNPVQVANDNATTLAVGDFNNDGKLDLVGKSLYLQVPVILSPTSVNFGSQNVGTKSPPQVVTAINDGKSALTISEVTFGGSDPNDFSQSNNCPASLTAGSSCNVAVVFQPQAGGPRAATLNFNYQGFASPQTVALSGVGAVSTVTLLPASLKFALQLVGTTSSPQTATLTNTGTVAVSISSIATTGAFTQTNNCPSSLPVNANCQIQVEFVPVKKGLAPGSLSVADSAQGSPQQVALSGTGTLVDISPLDINFGNQTVGTHSSPVPVNVKNVGKTSITIDQITIKGADAEDFSQTNNCGHGLSGGGSCTIQVTFTPKAKGKRSAFLEVIDNGGGSPQKVGLIGKGT
jgi:hypothetical protein